MTNCSLRIFSVIFFILCAVCSNAAEIDPGDNFETAAMVLSPGEELVLRGGIYTFNENVTVSVIESDRIWRRTWRTWTPNN
jgi:hypothetical protein